MRSLLSLLQCSSCRFKWIVYFVVRLCVERSDSTSECSFIPVFQVESLNSELSAVISGDIGCRRGVAEKLVGVFVFKVILNIRSAKRSSL